MELELFVDRGDDPLLLVLLRHQYSSELKHFSDSQWKRMAHQALVSGLAPLLYCRFRADGAESYVPSGAMSSLRTGYFQNSKRDFLLYRELSAILENLHSQQMPVIVLKGAALADLVYQNRALRAMGDVDLLVSKGDLDKAKETLVELGYSSIKRYHEGQGWHEKGEHHLPIYSKGNGDKYTQIEVHWDIEYQDNPFRLNIDEIWQRSQSAEIAGIEALVLCPEDLIIHLCLHISYHHKLDGGIKGIVDISETIRHYQEQINWDRLVSISSEYGTNKFIYLVLSLTRRMLGSDVPDHVLKELKPDLLDPKLLDLAERRILSSALVSHSFADAFTREKAFDRIKAFLKYIFPPRGKIAAEFSVSEKSIFIYPYYISYIVDFLKRRRLFLKKVIIRDKDVMSELKLDRWLSD